MLTHLRHPPLVVDRVLFNLIQLPPQHHQRLHGLSPHILLVRIVRL